MTTFTSDEKRLINHAKKAVVKYNKLRKARGGGGIDTIYAFVISDSGKIYDGACLETNLPHSNICAERHAIANMILKETYKAKIKSVVIADPVPEKQKHGTKPCGTCRHVIWELGTPNTTVICIQYIQQKNRWVFPKIEKHAIKELYPYPFKPIKWG